MVKFTVVASGESRVKVRPQRGLRQRDPLSPYLFIVVKDVLSKIVQKDLESGQLSSVLSNAFSYIFVADDAILFLKVEIESACAKIKQFLYTYGRAMGQKINFDKSGVLFSSNMCAIGKSGVSLSLCPCGRWVLWWMIFRR